MLHTLRFLRALYDSNGFSKIFTPPERKRRDVRRFEIFPTTRNVRPCRVRIICGEYRGAITITCRQSAPPSTNHLTRVNAIVFITCPSHPVPPTRVCIVPRLGDSTRRNVV